MCAHKIREHRPDYDRRVTEKRALIEELQTHRIELMKQVFLDLEGSEVYSSDYSRDQRHGAIAAGMCMDFKGASIILDRAANDHGSPVKALKGLSSAVPDLCYNS